MPFTITLYDKQYIDNNKADLIFTAVFGSNVVVNDAVNAYLGGLTVYGQTTQAGDPSPAVPASIITSEPTISVGESGKEMPQAIEFPALAGLLASSAANANYVDENKQGWWADTIDLETGLLVRRVDKITLDGTEDWHYVTASSIAYLDAAIQASASTARFALCDILARSPKSSLADIPDLSFHINASGRIYVRNMAAFSSVATVKQWFVDNNALLVYALAEPTEEPAPPALVQAMRALRTYKPNTVFDCNTGFTAFYGCDTKAYIDKMIQQAIKG